MRRFLLIACLIAPFEIAIGQDIEGGGKVFSQCRACHQVGETAKNGVGPHLNGLFGRKVGTVEGYSFSTANKNSGLIWDDATFAEYIKDPRAKVPGTKMVYAGPKDDQRVKDLTASMVPGGSFFIASCVP